MPKTAERTTEKSRKGKSRQRTKQRLSSLVGVAVAAVVGFDTTRTNASDEPVTTPSITTPASAARKTTPAPTPVPAPVAARPVLSDPYPELADANTIVDLHRLEKTALDRFLVQLLAVQKELQQTQATYSPKLRQLISAEQTRWEAYDKKAATIFAAAGENKNAERFSRRPAVASNQNVETFVRELFTPVTPVTTTRRYTPESVGTIGDFMAARKREMAKRARATR